MYHPGPFDRLNEDIGEIDKITSRQDVYRTVKDMLENSRAGKILFEFRFPSGEYRCNAVLDGEKIRISHIERAASGEIDVAFYLDESGSYSPADIDAFRQAYDKQDSEPASSEKLLEDATFAWDYGTHMPVLGGGMETWDINRYGHGVQAREI
ncbi:MAG: hypothetical protein HY364_02745 [Candidatus Aenigmarchaeota archaeon]|nr:hypothetical protein [Candidatus Aenigmarchaeota archaeon]